jgi:hypothetical protein
MQAVENNPLEQGHTFEHKETMMIRIGEEANLRNIRTKVTKSCTLRYEVAGLNFYVSAANGAQGWMIKSLCCRDNHDTLLIPSKYLFIPEKTLRSPFTGEWLGHILMPHLETSPGLSYVHLRGLLVNYARLDLISDNVLQQSRDWAKFQLFGDPNSNVTYCEGVREAIIGMGHSCELLFSDRRDVIRTLRSTLVREEIKRREDNKEPVLERGEITENFIRNWLIENEAPLTSQLGMEDGPTQKFLTGIFIATSASKAQVPFLQ